MLTGASIRFEQASTEATFRIKIPDYININKTRLLFSSHFNY